MPETRRAGGIGSQTTQIGTTYRREVGEQHPDGLSDGLTTASGDASMLAGGRSGSARSLVDGSGQRGGSLRPEPCAARWSKSDATALARRWGWIVPAPP